MSCIGKKGGVSKAVEIAKEKEEVAVANGYPKWLSW